MIGRWNKESAPEAEEPKGFDAFEMRLGDVMRGERATIGKSLLDVQRDLKIKATYIAAIENSDPGAFETPGFIAGYVRSYARYLNMDAEWVFDTFCEESGFVVAHGMSPAASVARQQRSAVVPSKGLEALGDPNALFVPQGQGLWSRIEPGALGSSLVLLALIGAIGYGGWSVLQEIQKVELAPVEQAPGLIADVAGISGNLVTLASAPDVISRPNADALDRLYRPQALDVPVLIARDGPISAILPADLGAFARTSGRMGDDNFELASAETMLSPMPPVIEDVPVQVVAAAPPQVVLIASSPSWVRVKSADGTVLFEKILDSGESYVLPATEEAPLLRAGNAGSVWFSVNGETYGPAGKAGGVVKNVELDADALKLAYNVAEITPDSTLARTISVAQAAALLTNSE
ncbi:helix-turn-helix domain-containing protein [Candidatus Halocynthiibacter alkanivorans]|jgi:RodZ C-terminal domain/Helix-turn-helix domain|uniref:helix-turn-helix domain-containing protein n=1 Tax=Candidatus Halocynthiibacter alkanivorans TaxID=2267619 RepID=UPI000DF39B76|nr:helix-turn-helix domain-containing protein [Candidatus Halocynthiibacter alkanivorans]